MPNQLRSLLGTIRKKPTRAADGRPPEAANGHPNDTKTSISHDLANLGLKNARTIVEAIPLLASGDPIDDKELLLENGVSMLQGMPLNSSLSEKISDGFITMLWHDLPHPPPTIAGPTARYRRHDGGGNSPWDPELGKAGSPYARNVPPLKPKGPNLPNVEDVYEALLKREGPFRKHPSGLNRLFFSFATVVIHECFQTSRSDPWINETSSYVDLSTLYGNTEEEQKYVRTYENGLIYPDSIASVRIMMMPPGVVAVMLLFSRNHNRIAENLFTVNESGRYKPWNKLDDAGKKWQDEDIFQLTRNINVGFFASVVLRDYVAAILNTPRANSEWSLALGKDIRERGKRVERGTGNLVSVEFAVLYHWHAALSAADDQWMEDIIRDAFPDLNSVQELTPGMYKEMMMNYGSKFKDQEPREWTFGGLQRGPDGRFDDRKLADLIKDCIEEPAHAFGARGTPQSLKIVDIMGQLQARDVFNVCTLNEFRRYLNLKPYDSFEDWNPDITVARAAELLYGDIENMELYPGLMAECTKPFMPGSGVCPGQTTGRGILDDAVSLVRGDRFLSYDLNSNTLTHWGAAKLQEPAAGSYGGVLSRLIFNALPGGFLGTSSYALLPFYTPEAAREILKGNGVLHLYESSRPPSDREIFSIQTNEGCKKALEDYGAFRTMYQAALRNVTGGNEFLIGWDDPKCHDPRTKSLRKLLFEDGFEQNVAAFFSTTIQKLIQKNSLATVKGRRSLDVIRDVTNIVPVLWLAERFAIPLKTTEQPKGVLSIYEMLTAYLTLFIYQNFNIRPAEEWRLRDAAVKAAEPLRKIFQTHLKTQSGAAEHFVDWLAKGSAFEVGTHADRLYHGLIETKLPIEELVADCIGISTPIIGNLTQQASLLVDLYLRPEYDESRRRIIQLAQRNDVASGKELLGFVFEGIRHANAIPGLPRVTTRDVTIIDGARGSIFIPADHTVLIATSMAAMDPAAFPEPEKINPHRPTKDYSMLFGHGLHYCLGQQLASASLTATLREIFKLKNVRRAPGKQGVLTTVEYNIGGLRMKKYLDASSREAEIPTSLTLHYDE
ncbi:hypothetical protein DPSP01_001146 [Paraphaeosphaeria sporulosa]